jgi:hypothetical protein
VGAEHSRLDPLDKPHSDWTKAALAGAPLMRNVKTPVLVLNSTEVKLTDAGRLSGLTDAVKLSAVTIVAVALAVVPAECAIVSPAKPGRRPSQTAVVNRVNMRQATLSCN